MKTIKLVVDYVDKWKERGEIFVGAVQSCKQQNEMKWGSCGYVFQAKRLQKIFKHVAISWWVLKLCLFNCSTVLGLDHNISYM